MWTILPQMTPFIKVTVLFYSCDPTKCKKLCKNKLEFLVRFVFRLFPSIVYFRGYPDISPDFASGHFPPDISIPKTFLLGDYRLYGISAGHLPSYFCIIAYMDSQKRTFPF